MTSTVSGSHVGGIMAYRALWGGGGGALGLAELGFPVW